MVDSPPPNRGGHVLTDADRLRGGSMKKPGSGIINAIKNRKKCNTRCFIFEICPLMPLSISKQNTGSPCLLNKAGNALIRQFVRVFVSGEKGLVDEINHIIYLYGMDIETAPESVKKNYADLLMRWHDQQFIRSKREMEQKPQLTVVINELGRNGIEVQREVVPVIESGSIRLGNKRGAQLAELVESVKADDPESLMNSPMVSEILDLSTPIREVRHVQEQDNQDNNDASGGTEGEPEELEEASESTGRGAGWGTH